MKPILNVLFFFIVIALFLFGLNILDSKILALEARVALLETKAKATIEIHVERAYDADMGVYDYQLCGSSKAATPIKRGRKRMSRLRLKYGSEAAKEF